MKPEKKDMTLKELGEMMTYVVKHMATKEDLEEVRNTMATKEDLAEVRNTMATKEDLEEVRNTMATKEDIEEVRKDMATKSELAEVKNITMSTASELTIVRRDVEEIKEKVDSHDGFAKEVDHVLSRIVVIEKHVGIAPPEEY
ncbi:hypothetical protein FJY93_05065 [Candidatus Kaiserbacteria bacterium]|nr:hypothetical protein [Candidatus Kaiserbacteria bacterium]